MVVDVARDRAGHAVRLQRAVRHRGHAQLDTRGPERVVVVIAVDAERVEAVRPRRRARAVAGAGVEKATGMAGHHDGLEAELADGVAQHGDGVIRIVHRHDGTHRHAVGVRRVEAADPSIDRLGHRRGNVGVGDLEQAERHRRIEDGEVDAHLVEPLVEQPRQVRGGAIAGVPTLPAPPRRHGPPLAPHRRVVAAADRDRCVERAADLPVPVAQIGAALVLQVRHDLVVEQRAELDEVAVGIDDRVIEAGPDLGRLADRRLEHGESLSALCHVDRRDQTVTGRSWRSPSMMTSTRSSKKAIRPSIFGHSGIGNRYVHARSSTSRSPMRADQ